jgi:hypothetical protein
MISEPDRVASDPESNGSTRAPNAVTSAIHLMWASIGCQIGSALLQSARESAAAHLFGSLIGLILVVIVQRWINRRLLLARNWMRFALLFFAIIGLAFTKQFVARELPLFASRDAVALFDSLSWLANLVSIALLFSPSANAWFQKMRAADSSS